MLSAVVAMILVALAFALGAYVLAEWLARTLVGSSPGRRLQARRDQFADWYHPHD